MNKSIAYGMSLKDRSIWYLDKDGGILHDGTRGMDFAAPHDSWKILGFSTRHNARDIISLEDAVNGANLGQGWIHDLDHGTHRMWGMPKSQRVVKVWRAQR